VRGCGETIMALRVFRVDSPMQQMVDSGLVQGTTSAMTPIGLAYLRMPRALSSSTSPQVLIPRWSQRVPRVLVLILASLSS